MSEWVMWPRFPFTPEMNLPRRAPPDRPATRGAWYAATGHEAPETTAAGKEVPGRLLTSPATVIEGVPLPPGAETVF